MWILSFSKRHINNSNKPFYGPEIIEPSDTGASIHSEGEKCSQNTSYSEGDGITQSSEGDASIQNSEGEMLISGENEVLSPNHQDQAMIPENPTNVSEPSTNAAPDRNKLRRSTRSHKGTRTVQTYGEEYCKQAITVPDKIPGDIQAHSTIITPSLTVLSAPTDPDTLYFHQAMKEPDADKFLAAANREFEDLVEKDVFEIVPASKVPEGETIFQEYGQ